MKHQLFYWSAERASAEIDFILQKDGKIFSIEVKAEENLKAKSLKLFKQYNPNTQANRTSTSPYRDEDWMTNVPLYGLGVV